MEIERIIENYDKRGVECLAGEGVAPPEDVGGEMGYEEFLKAISDPKHENHKSMQEWVGYRWQKEFDIDKVKRYLRDV